MTRPGKHTKSYGKLPFIVDLPIKNGGSFHSYVKIFAEGNHNWCVCMFIYIYRELIDVYSSIYQPKWWIFPHLGPTVAQRVAEAQLSTWCRSVSNSLDLARSSSQPGRSLAFKGHQDMVVLVI